MAFTITLYNCKDDPRSLNKTLENGTPISSVKPTGIVDILNPTFELGYSSTNDKDLTTKNYCVVGSPFNRSYFITDMKIDIGKKIIISCAVDVLQTYKDKIEDLSANVIRQENLTESYLPDSEYKIKAGFQNYTDVFSGGTASLYYQGEYILNWIGGLFNSSGQFVALFDEPADWSTNWGTYYIFDGNEYAMRQLSSVYPSATTAPSFNAITGTWGRVYYKNT